MKTVNIGALKNNLSGFLRDVKNGEEVLVKDRDNKPIARIVPIRPEEETHPANNGAMKLQENPQGIDWEAFWAAPRPNVSADAVREAIDWAKGDR